MRRLCDLHTHSLASDGCVAPAEIVALADRKRLAAVALTDHDTLDGLAEAVAAAAAYPELDFVCGIEISATLAVGDAHILGLHVDPTAASLEDVARQLRKGREERNPKMVRRLRDVGVEITIDEVVAAAGSGPADKRVVGRPHIAAVLVAKGYARDIGDAFQRYLQAGAGAYVPRPQPTAHEAIAAIHAAGGAAILAHPVHLEFDNHAQCERIICTLIPHGLDGVEVYHPDQTDLFSRFLLDLARRRGLVVTGGSDFHGRDHEHLRIGSPRVPKAVLEPLEARARANRDRRD